MENKAKQQPATHQPLQQTLQSTPHHQYHTRLHSPQPNGIVHQLLMQPPINYQPNSPIQDARSPLLENQQDLYGTRQPLEYSRHYGSRDSNYVYGQSPTQQRLEQRHLVSNPQYNHNIEHEVPKGYNAEVYNAYMRRNPPNNMEHNQIYQNHQSLYHQQSPEQQYTPSKPYLPYTNRIQSNTELLKQQYNEIQQMKLQQQMHYQNQAQMQQQQTFAQRQLMLQHIHGVQPPPNMQQSLYSDGSRSQKSLDDMIQLSSPHRDGREKTPVGANTSVSNVASPSSQTSPESTSPSVKSPSSESRRSSGGTQVLRLPVAQRVMSAPVTMSGWLYKQGSDVLKVWRKRWFVLTDYCLFYYKSQDEEKLLGSVLLPSYTISACTPEDRVTKKHAFKCAHANMRTYVLAAPDQNLARRWCEVLTRASLMEEGSKRHQNRAARDPNNQAEGDDDAGSDDVAPGQPTYANAPPKPRRSNDGYHSPSPDRYDPNYDLLRKPSSQYGQSTAPASPKQPLSTTSPSANKELENLYEARKSVPAQQPHYRSKQSYNAQNLSLPLTNTATDRLENTKSPASYNDSRNNVKTPNYYDNRTSESVNIRTANTTKTELTNQQRKEQFKNEENIRNYKEYKENKEERIENYDQLRQKERPEYPSNNSMGNERMTIERRTPDAYGRSAIVPGYYGKGKASDYEDIYPNYVGGDGYSVIPAYSRPLSPPSYGEKMGRSPGAGYESHQGYQMTDLDATQNYAGPPVLRRKKALAAKPQNNTVPRPHSADFLEYESKAQAYQPTVPNDNAKYGIAKQPPRPKSSLDINSYYDPSSDSYYSEESYAEKMRQSSQYLQRRGLSLNAKLTNPKSQLEQLYSANLTTANYSDPRSNAEGSYGLRTSDKEVLSCDSKYSESGLSSNWTLRDKNLSDYPNRSNSAMSESSNVSVYGRDGGSKQDLMAGDGFMRSASARLPSTGMDNGKDGERKVQQREESMKRLLEWKQRMLQSPLTRKSTPAALSLARTLNQTRLPAAKHQSELVSGKAGSRYRHSTQQGNVCYNSYSSDDEENLAVANDKMEKQAGRSDKWSLETKLGPVPPIPEPVHPHVTADDPQKSPKPTAKVPDTLDAGPNSDAQSVDSDDARTLKQPSDEDTERANTIIESVPKININLEHKCDKSLKDVVESEAESDLQVEYTDNDLDEVLTSEDESLETRSNYDQVLEKQSSEVNNENKNVAKPETPTFPVNAEDHYLPMSPRKAMSPEPAHKTIINNISVFDQNAVHSFEDNPYVEMSQNVGLDSAFANDELQTYEIVCVNNGKVEPVYMELSNVSNVHKEKVKKTSSSKSDTKSDDANARTSTLKKRKDSETKNTRDDVKSPLPDILMNSNSKNLVRSDSSDADDEASKDFSLDVPFSRFSISDTFRPASYYLGSSRALLELQDSSDSEIVSPPPIPTSPPPVEELELTNRDSIPFAGSPDSFNYQKCNTVKRKTTSLMIYGSTPSMHDTLFRGEKIRRSRASLPVENKLKKDFGKPLLPPKTSQYNLETESILSYNADHGSSRMSLDSDVSSKFDSAQSNIPPDIVSLNDTDDLVQLRNPMLTDHESLERMLKRRPLSDESFFEIGSLDSALNNPIGDIDLDKYLDNLQSTNSYLYQTEPSLNGSLLGKDIGKLDAASISYYNERVASIREEVQYENVKIDASLQAAHSRSASSPLTMQPQTVRPVSRASVRSTSALNASSSNSHRATPQSNVSEPIDDKDDSTLKRSTKYAKAPISFYSKDATDSSIIMDKNLNQIEAFDKVSGFEIEKTVVKSNDSKSSESGSNSCPRVAHSRDSSAEHSAPYYYSDLSSQEHINLTSAHHYNKNTNANRKLNNQRRKGPSHKKNDFTHIHNPIHSNMMLTNHLNSSSEGPFEIAAAARCVSVEFLSAADKTADIDMRNIYESSTLKRQKVRDSMSSLHSSHSSKNIYPSVSHDKTCQSNMCINQSLFMGSDVSHANALGLDTNSLNEGTSIIHNILSSSERTMTSQLPGMDEIRSLSNTLQKREMSSKMQNVPMDVSEVPSASGFSVESTSSMLTTGCEGDKLWDEDNLWRENLRRASQRHAKSMDDLDCLSTSDHTLNLDGRFSVDLKTMQKSQENKMVKTTKISRAVTYVNENPLENSSTCRRKVYTKRGANQTISEEDARKLDDEAGVYVELVVDKEKQVDEGIYEQLAIESEQNDARAQAKRYAVDNDKSAEMPEASDKGGKRKFEIDREKLRQWDLMSSGLLKNEGVNGAGSVVQTATGLTGGEVHKPSDADNEASISASLTGYDPPHQPTAPPISTTTSGGALSASKKALVGSSGSLGRGTRECGGIPVRAVSPRVRWAGSEGGGRQEEVYGGANEVQSLNIPGETWSAVKSPLRHTPQPIRAVSPRVRRLTDDAEEKPPDPNLPLIPSTTHPDLPSPGQLDLMLDSPLTAGELLGRTHEERVLLLIQLRRRQTAAASALEVCAAQVAELQNILNSPSPSDAHPENYHRLEQLKRHLLDLEQQYEKSKPLVHLVDNMVKLGSLYNRPGGSVPSTIDRLERNQELRQRLLVEQADEQRRWASSTDSLSREHIQRKVEQLAALERQLAVEAGTLHGLRADRDAIERVLGGVRTKFGDMSLTNNSSGGADPAGTRMLQLERRSEQQALEADLTRVHMMLAHNSKKLEQTVADNARLERELMGLRHKLQGHRMSEATMAGHGSVYDSAVSAANTTALLEDELRRVQQLVSDLQRQRQELSGAVRQLTDKSQNLAHSNTSLHCIGLGKKSHQPAWQETDLDSGRTTDHGSYETPHLDNTLAQPRLRPLYVDTQHSNNNQPYAGKDPSHQTGYARDEGHTNAGFGNMTNAEKQEIKTVRIVKRESERRQRDRERSVQPGAVDWSSNSNLTLDQMTEDDYNSHYNTRSTSLPRTFHGHNQAVYDDYYSTGVGSRNPPPNYLSLSNVNVPYDTASTPMEFSPKYPSSPSLNNNNDYSRDSSSFAKAFDYSAGKSSSTHYLDSPTDSNRTLTNGPLSKTSSVVSLSKTNAELSPIFKSEAARQIIIEMSGDVKDSAVHRRRVPREKRRHYTAPHHLSAKTLSELPGGDGFGYQEKCGGRSLDDVDMERALRAPPDVVRSALAPQRFAETTIDQLLAAPRKIVIPERYVPEKPPELSPEEQKKRLEKVESIKKMLSSTPSSDPSKSPDGEEKRQREHLLQMNQILAKQVMEMSKIVAVNALQNLPLEDNLNYDSDDRSPDVELPLYQQRENYFT